MGQLLIRNVDDSLIETLKRRAAAAGRSMEAEARAALERGSVATADERRAIVEALRAEMARLTVPGIAQTPSEILVREMRDER